MKVLFDPTPEQKGTGTTASISWANAELVDAMKLLFHCRDDEVISQIEVSADGITARFEKVVADAKTG